jgi:hypothetical protein
MKNYGLTSVSEFLDDRVVYRNLVPQDPRLPSLADIRPQLGLPEDLVPRKTAPEYAQVIVHLLEAARAVDAPVTPVERLVYVGDTPMNDGTAFINICRAGGWPGLAFIGADRDQSAKVEITEREKGTIYVANRWAAIEGFAELCRERGFALDEGAAVIVDLDKTAVGARGRNDHVIDRARVEAVRRTVGALLGEDYDPVGFQQAYDHLNQLEYHRFTADNQDYLAYICLILGSGLYRLESLAADVHADSLTSFQQFIAQVDAHADELPASLREIHEGVYGLVKQGDPTPFKAFRYNEYDTTVQTMGYLSDDAPVEDLLAREIVITQEVRELALVWRDQGAVLFGLSDKPDEASVPRPDQAAEGLLPIHRTETHAVGSA